MSSMQFLNAASGLATYTAYVTLGVLFFAGFGPPFPLNPGLSHLRIIDAPDGVISEPSVSLEGPFAPNAFLQQATVLFNNTIASSESVEFDKQHKGSIIMMDKYGHVFRAAADASAPGGYSLNQKPLAQLGPGRPLGYKQMSNGDWLVCNAGLGLVQLRLPSEANGLTKSEVQLVGAYVSMDSPIDPGSRIEYANDLDITSDGSVVYFTDSQVVPVLPNWGTTKRPWYDTYKSFLLGLYSGAPSGRLLAYYPHNGTIHVLVKGFFYSNGVALSGDESFVAVAETNMFRVLRFWLKGDKAGTMDILVDRLPGFPDGIDLAADGSSFWIAMPSPRTSLVDLALKWRIIRAVMAYLPDSIRPPVPTWGAIVKVDSDGKVLRFLHDPAGHHLSHISAVVEEKGGDGHNTLWLGSVKNHYIAYLDVNADTALPLGVE